MTQFFVAFAFLSSQVFALNPINFVMIFLPNSSFINSINFLFLPFGKGLTMELHSNS